MNTSGRIGLALLGLVLGGAIGGGLGLLGGLGYTTMAQTSGFEGYSGFVVVAWMMAGIVLGLAAGLVIGVKLGRRR